jgi:tetratricopeptide (TPR) repeat protein
MKTFLLILAFLQTVTEVYQTANADFDAGRWAEAASKYELVLKEDPTHIPSQFNLAVCYTKLEKMDAAIAAYRALIEQDGGIYEAHVNIAILLEQNGKRDEAGGHLEKARSLRPDDTQAILSLGMFHIRGDELDKAYPYLNEAAAKGASSVELFAALSEAEHTRKDEEKSRLYLEKALSLDPSNALLKHQLAVSYFTEKEYAKAAPVLEDLVKAEPGNPDYFYLLGKSYEQLKSYPRALAALQQTIRIKADYVEAYATLGTIFYGQKDWTRAAQVLMRVVELSPRQAVPHFVLATCFDNLGNEKAAVLHYNKFLELDDGSNDARSFQARQRARTLERRMKQ